MATQITRERAVELFVALGLTSATKWNAKRMAAKLAKIDEMVDEDTNLEGTADETLTTVLEAIENDEDIEVQAAAKEDAPAEPAKAKKGKGKGKGKDEEKPELKEGDEGWVDADAAEKKEKAAAEKKAAKEKAAAAKKKAAIPGVRATITRPFLAGQIIKKHGRKAGVTEAMVTELDEIYGKANPAESMFTLRNAWHAIRGFETPMDD